MKLGRNGRRARKEAQARRAFLKAVQERCRVYGDWYKCERCGSRERLVHAHHLIPLSRCSLDDRWNPANGRGLCAPCHRWVHDHPLLAKEQGWTL